MKRKYIKSASILYVKYDEENLILEVEYNNGGVYRYYGVPRAEYNKLMDAESRGAYMNKHIKTNYKTIKIE